MIDQAYIKRAVSMAMQAQDDWVLSIVYTTKDKTRTRRIVSPIRFIGQDKFEALCLCREEPRHFIFAQCEDVHLVHASEVLMPVEIEVLEGVASVE
jgi:predicted DNA-binding transcriptional regulator YafY